jgi:hypothetical protein
MRHRAIPGDPKDKPSSVLVNQRLHVKVNLDNPNYADKEGIFWFRKVKASFCPDVEATDPIHRRWAPGEP